MAVPVVCQPLGRPAAGRVVGGIHVLELLVLVLIVIFFVVATLPPPALQQGEAGGRAARIVRGLEGGARSG